MMAGFSNFYAAAVANHFFRGDVEASAQDRPAELFLALHSGDPTDNGNNLDEIEGGSYTRKLITFDAPDTDPEGSGFVTFIANQSNIVFANLPACEISHIGIWDDRDAGQLVFSDSIYISAATPTSIILNNGDSLSIPQGYIKIYIE
jgi:hypothetical protein